VGGTPSPPLEERVGERRHTPYKQLGPEALQIDEPLSLCPSPRMREEGGFLAYGGSRKIYPW